MNRREMNSSPNTYPKGVRFKPLDEELLSYYLEKKNQGKDSQITIIPVIPVLKHEPHELPALVLKRVPFGEREWFNPRDMQWYFFSPCDYMSSNRTRSNRTTQQGYWSITGVDRGIMSEGSKVEIGRKRIMTFYLRGKPKAQYRTNWVLHEYYLTEAHSDPPKQKGGFVLCVLKYKSGKKKKDKSGHEQNAPICDEAEPDVQSQAVVKGMNTESEENQLASKEPCSGGYHITPSALEIQAASNGMITAAEELLAYKELRDAVQIPNGNEDAFNGWQTDSCLIDKNELSNCFEGQPADSYNSSHSDMIEELFDEPENLDSLFPQPQPPQPHQLPQPHPPQVYCPSTLQSPIATELGNVSHGTNVHNDECRKRKYPFGDISINDDDELVSNTASISDNQATDGNLKGDFVICRMKNKSDKKDSSICDEGQPSCSHVVSNCENQAADDMIQEAQGNGESLLHPPPPLDDCCSLAVQSPTSLELEDVLQAIGTNDDCNDLQPPFRDNDSCIRDKNEDEKVYDMFLELCDLPEVNLDPLFRP